jgi:rhodanese-related sulfurtransferase
MKKHSWFGALTLMTLILGGGSSACLNSSEGVRQVTPQEASDLVNQQKAILVDVREAEELAESGSANGALWLPMSKQSDDTPEMKAFLEKVAPGGKKDREIIFYCRSGGRSGKAAAAFAKKGFKVANMGGFSGWQQAGLPVQNQSSP